MGRMAETPGRPADTSIHLRVNTGMLDWIDTHRGGRSRPAYIRSLIRSEALRAKGGTIPVAPHDHEQE